LRIETPFARAEARAQVRSCSACSRRHAARDARRSTRRSRRQAAIRSVIVTMTPLQVFSELDAKGGSSRSCYQYPYFGDAVVWFGLWLLACSHWLGVLFVASPVHMANILVTHTGKRLLEKHITRCKGAAYPDYMRRTSGFIPWPPGDNRAANSGARLACPPPGNPVTGRHDPRPERS
jgi:hypothetical protein